MKAKLWLIGIVFFLTYLEVGCGGKKQAITPISPGDTPALNYEAGMRYLTHQQHDEAIQSFERAKALDADYLPAYVGLGLAYMGKGDYETATKHIQGAIKKEEAYAPAYVALGRVYAAQGKYKDALKEFERAQDVDKHNADAYFYQGQTYTQMGKPDQAEAAYASALRINPTHTAGNALEELQKQKFAQAISPEYDVIATATAINRGDLAALFTVELNLEQKATSKIPQETRWRPPPSLMGKRDNPQDVVIIPDIANHWAKGYIQTVVELDIMDVYPDGTFRPNEPMTRANFALFIQTILGKALGDETLPTKFIGQTSPFPDVPNSHFAFNAIMVTTTRGIMPAKLNGLFGLTETVSGADALLTIRNLKEVLK